MSILATSLTKRFGSQTAVDNLSFEVSKGQILGFLGPNGAGKSTTMKMLTGYMKPDAGNAVIEGFDPAVDPLEAKRHIGYLPEHNPLYKDLYIREYLAIVARIHRIAPASKRVNELIELVGLQRESHKKIAELSKGYRQRVGLAQTLMHDPDVLILDEPTSGLDPNQLVEIRSLIRELGKTKAIVLSTHIMQEVQAICDRVLIINQGRMVLDETIEYLTNAISGQQVVTVEFDRKILTNSMKEYADIESIEEVREKVYRITTTSDKDLRPVLFKFAVEKGAVILEMQRARESIETIFQVKTKEGR